MVREGQQKAAARERVGIPVISAARLKIRRIGTMK